MPGNHVMLSDDNNGSDVVYGLVLHAYFVSVTLKCPDCKWESVLRQIFHIHAFLHALQSMHHHKVHPNMKYIIHELLQA